LQTESSLKSLSAKYQIQYCFCKSQFLRVNSSQYSILDTYFHQFGKIKLNAIKIPLKHAVFASRLCVNYKTPLRVAQLATAVYMPLYLLWSALPGFRFRLSCQIRWEIYHLSWRKAVNLALTTFYLHLLIA